MLVPTNLIGCTNLPHQLSAAHLVLGRAVPVQCRSLHFHLLGVVDVMLSRQSKEERQHHAHKGGPDQLALRFMTVKRKSFAYRNLRNKSPGPTGPSRLQLLGGPFSRAAGTWKISKSWIVLYDCKFLCGVFVL
mmetsp:Transcript_84098/g.224810  ORF Transcript_84098/g.224810 Transcript_84098/m.224810 type:complete len:133 (-) Transcript_84098:149-547(-)